MLLNRGTRVLTVNDFITLTGLRVFAHHGVFEHEKQDGQEFVIDVVAWLDLSAAGRSDDLTRTVHYGELAEAVVAEASVNPADLIETVLNVLQQWCYLLPLSQQLKSPFINLMLH